MKNIEEKMDQVPIPDELQEKIDGIIRMCKEFIINSEKREKKCIHSLGLAYYKDELDTTISQDNLKEIKSDYADGAGRLEWFKYCPYCNKKLLPIDRDE